MQCVICVQTHQTSKLIRFPALQSIMQSILLFLCVLLFTQHISDAVFEPPTKGTTVFCFALECVQESVDALAPYNPTYIGVFSYSFADDSYLGLYLGSLLELFDMPEFNFVAMVLQNPEGMDKAEAIIQYLQILPENSIFASVEHGRSMTGMNTLQMLSQLGVVPKVVYHLNHEQPWQVDETDYMNFIFGSVEELTDLYSQFNLVLRNYYYTPLLSTSYYLPVSAPYEGYVVQNASSVVFASSQTKPASQRSIKCHFKGRVDYAKYDHDGASLSEVPRVLQSDEFFPQAIERREIIRLSQENKLGGCVASSSDARTTDAYVPGAVKTFMGSYNEYMKALAETVFVLCPSGNNAETFRHTEAMEFGAIPIILQPTDPTRNYLNDHHWQGYPGPVLTSWDQLEAFLAGMTESKMDALQADVKTWYAAAKARKKEKLAIRLRAAFQGERYITHTNYVPTNHNVASSDRTESDVKRIIQDLRFGEIPSGAYAQSIQSLLAMVLKQEAKIHLLEQKIERLLTEK